MTCTMNFLHSYADVSVPTSTDAPCLLWSLNSLMSNRKYSPLMRIQYITRFSGSWFNIWQCGIGMAKQNVCTCMSQKIFITNTSMKWIKNLYFSSILNECLLSTIQHTPTAVKPLKGTFFVHTMKVIGVQNNTGLHWFSKKRSSKYLNCSTDESKSCRFLIEMRVNKWWQDFHFLGELCLLSEYFTQKYYLINVANVNQ